MKISREAKEDLEKSIESLKFELEEKDTQIKTLKYKLMTAENNEVDSSQVQSLIEKNTNLANRVFELESQIKQLVEMNSIDGEMYNEDELDNILNK